MEEEGKVMNCNTLDEWNEKINAANEAKRLIVIDFSAPWSGPSRFISPFFSELAKKLPSVSFFKIDVDCLKSVADDFKIEAMPTFIFMREGKIVDRFIGAKKDELQQTLAKHLAAS